MEVPKFLFSRLRRKRKQDRSSRHASCVGKFARCSPKQTRKRERHVTFAETLSTPTFQVELRGTLTPEPHAPSCFPFFSTHVQLFAHRHARSLLSVYFPPRPSDNAADEAFRITLLNLASLWAGPAMLLDTNLTVRSSY